MRTGRNEFLSIWLILTGFCIAAGVVLFLCYTARQKLPDTVGRMLSAEEQKEIIDRNSSLIEYIRLTANADFPRKNEITKITIHHMAGDISLEALGESFSKADRKASSNYAVDSSGRVAMYVEESNRAWTSSSRENDNQAVTIEVANDENGGNWHVSDAAYKTLIELCVDICRRNDIEKLVYTGDSQGNLTIHKMFSSGTECPGPYLESKMSEIADTVNERLKNR